MRPALHPLPAATSKLGRRWRLGLIAAGLVLTAAFAAAALSTSRSNPVERSSVGVATAAEPEADVAAPDAAIDTDAEAHKARLATFMQRVSAWRTVERLLHISPARVVVARRGPAIRPGSTPLECMTQAIYYEARGEPEAGQTAVAQVVLNRSRLPQYPKSICGVVFQGSTR
ncbi:cell wall hydrolase, partial [Mycobacterium tuberculosis]